MTSIDDERNTAKEAEAVLRSLASSLSHTQLHIDTLRNAATIATKAATQSFSSQAGLNALRDEAATALNGAAGSLANGLPFTQERIRRAKDAVAAWLEGLSSAERGLKPRD